MDNQETNGAAPASPASGTVSHIGAGGLAAPDTAALQTMEGAWAVATRGALALDGTYTPAEARLYTSFMKISYGVGFGAELGVAPGSLVLDKKDVVAGPRIPVVGIILKARGFWREWKDYDGTTLPKDFNTEADAIKAGFRTQNPPFGSGLPLRNCAPAVDLALFLRKPTTGTSSMAFTYLLNGQLYAPVRFVVDGARFQNIARVLDQLPKLDAADRGVPPGEGVTSAYFVTFTTDPIVKPGKVPGEMPKTIVKLWMSLLLDANQRPVKVDPKTVQDIAAITAQLKAAASAQAAVSAEEPADAPVPF